MRECIAKGLNCPLNGKGCAAAGCAFWASTYWGQDGGVCLIRKGLERLVLGTSFDIDGEDYGVAHTSRTREVY